MTLAEACRILDISPEADMEQIKKGMDRIEEMVKALA